MTLHEALASDQKKWAGRRRWEPLLLISGHATGMNGLDTVAGGLARVLLDQLIRPPRNRSQIRRRPESYITLGFAVDALAVLYANRVNRVPLRPLHGRARRPRARPRLPFVPGLRSNSQLRAQMKHTEYKSSTGSCSAATTRQGLGRTCHVGYAAVPVHGSALFKYRSPSSRDNASRLFPDRQPGWKKRVLVGPYLKPSRRAPRPWR